jgi:hypothetical protein
MNLERLTEWDTEMSSGIDAISRFCISVLADNERTAKAIISRVQYLSTVRQVIWPSWCYVPTGVVSEEVMRTAPWLSPAQLGQTTIVLQAALSWLHGRYVARFSVSRLLKAEAEVGREFARIPSLRLLRLPAYAVFVESRAQLTAYGLHCDGYLVNLDYIPGREPLLNVLTFVPKPSSSRLDKEQILPIPHILPLKDMTYTESLFEAHRANGLETFNAAGFEDLLRVAAHVAKVADLVAEVSMQEMDHRQEPLKSNGDFGFGSDLTVINVVESLKNIH